MNPIIHELISKGDNNIENPSMLQSPPPVSVNCAMAGNVALNKPLTAFMLTWHIDGGHVVIDTEYPFSDTGGTF